MRDCLHKLQSLLEEASWIPKERIATKPPAWSNEKRLEVQTVLLALTLQG